MILTIVGAGNGGHVLAALAGSLPNVSVRILTTRPHVFGKVIEVQRPGIGGGHTVSGRIDRVSSVPSEVLPGSDIVIWCGPVVATKDAFALIAPHVQPTGSHTPYVGCLFAQGCIHLLAKKMLGSQVPFFAFQSIPWLCRTLSAGKASEIVGRKDYANIACHRVNFIWLRRALEPCLGSVRMIQLSDFASIVLNPANQIIHPARYWGIFKDWDGQPIPESKIPWLYRDFDGVSAEALEGLDDELQQMKKSLEVEAPELDLQGVMPLADRILSQYGDQVADPRTLQSIMATNQAYSMARTPVRQVEGGVVPNAAHRVVQDDIPHGLCVLKDIAEKLGQATPWIDLLLGWHQDLMGKQYLVAGRLSGRDIGETSALSVLGKDTCRIFLNPSGGTTLSNIGYVDAPILPCKL